MVALYPKSIHLLMLKARLIQTQAAVDYRITEFTDSKDTVQGLRVRCSINPLCNTIGHHSAWNQVEVGSVPHWPVFDRGGRHTAQR